MPKADNIINMDHFNQQQVYTANQDIHGRVRIWSLSPTKTIDKLLLDKSNLITMQGADIAAKALSGLPNSAISHIYVSYSNTNPGTPAAVTVGDTAAWFPSNATARVPLAFTPGYANEPGYTSNLVYFTVYITGAAVPDSNYITGLGLVSAGDPSNAAYDKLFSHITFNGIQYVASQGIAITWGLTFRAAGLPVPN